MVKTVIKLCVLYFDQFSYRKILRVEKFTFVSKFRSLENFLIQSREEGFQ